MNAMHARTAWGLLGETRSEMRGEPYAFHVIARSGGPEDGLSRPSSHKLESCRRRRAVRVGRVRVHAIQAGHTRRTLFRVTTKDSPSSGFSARRPSRRSFALQRACTISSFADSIAKNSGALEAQTIEEVNRRGFPYHLVCDREQAKGQRGNRRRLGRADQASNRKS